MHYHPPPHEGKAPWELADDRHSYRHQTTIRKGTSAMIDMGYQARALHVARQRIREMHEMARQDALARQFRRPSSLRRYLGNALIAAGHVLVDSAYEPACDYGLAVADK